MSAVDVVIPAFDAAAHLGEAIASVRAQSRAASRIIVVDDASTDATAAVALAAGANAEATQSAGMTGRLPAATPVGLVRLASNRGAAAARNAGFAATRTPLVAFLDADDRWTPRKLELQCAALEEDPALAFVLCRLRQFVSPEVDEAGRRVLACDDAPQEGWSASALLVRRGAFEAVGGFPEALRVGEAIDWFNRARHLPHAMLELVGVERRLHAANSTRRARVTGRDYLDVVRRHRARLRSQGQG